MTGHDDQHSGEAGDTGAGNDNDRYTSAGGEKSGDDNAGYENASYEKDFAAWCREQAQRLRDGDIDDLDTGNLAAEVAELSRGEQRALESHLSILLWLLLRREYKPGKHYRSADYIIKQQRRIIQRLVRRNPSLCERLDEALVEAYGDAILTAAAHTGMDETSFPSEPPYSPSQALDPDFWPSAKPQRPPG